MQTAEALSWIRAALGNEAILYFEVHLDSAAIVAEVAEAMRNEGCSITAVPSEGLLKVSRIDPRLRVPTQYRRFEQD